MLRLIAAALFIFIYLFINLPALFRAGRLDKKGDAAKRDALVERKILGFVRGVLRVAGVSVCVEGIENVPGRAAVYIANHQGNFDSLAIIACAGPAKGFMVKSELLHIPVVSGWMKLLGCVFVDRKNRERAAAAVRDAVAKVSAGRSFVVFPEGTRSRGGQIGPFKYGGFKIALEAGAPIVPVALEGSHLVLEASARGLHHAEIKMLIGKPIETEGLSEEEKTGLAERVRAEVVALHSRLLTQKEERK